MAYHDERRTGRLGIREQQIEERLLTVAVERGGRLVGDDELRRADQRARRRYALLLADAEARRRLMCDQPCSSPRLSSKPPRLGMNASGALRTLPPPAEKLNGSTTLSMTEP